MNRVGEGDKEIPLIPLWLARSVGLRWTPVVRMDARSPSAPSPDARSWVARERVK